MMVTRLARCRKNLLGLTGVDGARGPHRRPRGCRSPTAPRRPGQHRRRLRLLAGALGALSTGTTITETTSPAARPPGRARSATRWRPHARPRHRELLVGYRAASRTWPRPAPAAARLPTYPADVGVLDRAGHAGHLDWPHRRPRSPGWPEPPGGRRDPRRGRPGIEQREQPTNSTAAAHWPSRRGAR